MSSDGSPKTVIRARKLSVGYLVIGNQGTHFHLSVCTLAPLHVSEASLWDLPFPVSVASSSVAMEGRWLGEREF